MNGRARGFTLEESLVPLMLLSVGLLGAGILLVSGLRSHSDALRQVAATNLARDMADRIRANPRGRGPRDDIPLSAVTLQLLAPPVAG